jgi:hypothetical protein
MTIQWQSFGCASNATVGRRLYKLKNKQQRQAARPLPLPPARQPPTTSLLHSPSEEVQRWADASIVSQSLGAETGGRAIISDRTPSHVRSARTMASSAGGACRCGGPLTAAPCSFCGCRRASSRKQGKGLRRSRRAEAPSAAGRPEDEVALPRVVQIASPPPSLLTPCSVLADGRTRSVLNRDSLFGRGSGRTLSLQSPLVHR